MDPATRSLYYVSSGLWPDNNVIRVDYGALGMSQGTGQGQRIGNRIRNKKFMFNFVLRARAYDASTNPSPQANMVRMVLFYERDAPTDTPNPTTDFFNLGNGFQSINGDLADQIATFNTDVYRILAVKSFKLGAAANVAGDVATTNPNGYNNDFQTNVLCRWDITKYIPKMVRYPDNVTLPSSRGLWCCVMLSPAAAGVGSSGVVPVFMQYWLSAEYSDS